MTYAYFLEMGAHRSPFTPINFMSGDLMMKKVLLGIGMCAVIASMVGCSTSTKQDLANLPAPKNETEAAQRLIALAAGYCQGLAEKDGTDFKTCFKERTDHYLQVIQDGSAKLPEKAEKVSMNFRTVDVDGQKISLADTLFSDNGKDIYCQRYIQNVAQNPAKTKMDVTLGELCETSL
jgi:hypothetical protein